MITFVLLFAVWPFHHKKPAAVSDYIIAGCRSFDEGCPPHPQEDFCDKQDGLYFYLGDDNMIGISGASCVDAKHQWQVTHIDPVRMSRS